ncbi:hypothetical protein B0H13DRAFT_1893570 [Mycena leptocephala]|nr:hypothetical protein B0H13DRAFT_1893570 [Mycena leptocephala]
MLTAGATNISADGNASAREIYVSQMRSRMRHSMWCPETKKTTCRTVNTRSHLACFIASRRRSLFEVSGLSEVDPDTLHQAYIRALGQKFQDLKEILIEYKDIFRIKSESPPHRGWLKLYNPIQELFKQLEEYTNAEGTHLMAFELSSDPDNEITNQMVPGSREQPWGRPTGIVEFLQFSTPKFDTSVLASKEKTGGQPERMEFLWVCWFGGDINHAAGWESRHLPHVGFLDAADPDGGSLVSGSRRSLSSRASHSSISLRTYLRSATLRILHEYEVEGSSLLGLHGVGMLLVSQASSDDRRRSIKSLGHRYERSMDVLGAPAELWSCSTARGNDMVAAIRRGFKAKFGITALLE